MFKIFLISLVLVCAVSAGIKTETVKIVKPDTAITIKPDTTITITFDTLKITRTYNDTLIFLKADTAAKSPSKPQLISKQPVGKVPAKK